MAGVGQEDRYDYQAPALCGDCQNQRSVVSSYCLDCKVDLCDACKAKNLHKKHRALPRAHSAVKRARKVKKYPCKSHPDEHYFTYCSTCKTPCCPICAIKGHGGHSFRDIADVADDAKDVIKSNINALEVDLQQTSEIVQKAIMSRISQYNKSMEQMTKDSKKIFQFLREEIDRVELDWVKQTTKTKEMHLRIIERQKKDVENQIKRIVEDIQACEDILKHPHDLDVLTFLSGYKAPVIIALSDVIFPPLVRLQPSNYTFPTLSELVGKIIQKKEDSEENKPVPKATPDKGVQTATNEKGTGKGKEEKRFEPSKIKVKTLKTFQVKIRPDTLLHNKFNDVWISDRCSRKLNIYEEDFKLKKTLTFDFAVKDMTLSSSKDVVATDGTNKRLIRIHSSGSIDTICSTAPLSPCGVCVNNRRQILVGVSAGYRTPPIKLLVYSTDGSNILQEIEKDENGKPIFKGGIYQVKQNSQRDYIVSSGNRIVGLSNEGKYGWEYQLEGSVFGLACDQFDNVIAADRLNHTIYLLNCEGILIRTLMKEKDGISNPWSLSVDNEGTLWIGQDNVKVVKYLR